MGEGAVSESVGLDEGVHDRAFALNTNHNCILKRDSFKGTFLDLFVKPIHLDQAKV